MTAYNPKGSGTPEQQRTRYIYGCIYNASLQTIVVYPESTDTVTADTSGLTFVVGDDGAGFDTSGKGLGAGFQNMLDRLGALGGTLHVASAPGRGTKVTGALPAVQLEAAT